MSFLLALVIVLMLNYSALQKIDWSGFYSYEKAKWAISLNEAMAGVRESIGRGDNKQEIRINIRSKVGNWQNVSPETAMQMRALQVTNANGWQLIYYLMNWVFIGTISLFVSIFLLWGRLGRKLTKEQSTKDGEQVLDVAKARPILTKLKQAREFHIGQLPLIKDAETRHFLITGATGSGKTNWLHNLLP